MKIRFDMIGLFVRNLVQRVCSYSEIIGIDFN